MGSTSNQSGGPLDDGAPWSWQDIPELDLAIGWRFSERRSVLAEPVTGSGAPVRQPLVEQV